jgi:hypothetical protein
MRAANKGAPINKICPAAGSTTNQHGSQLTLRLLLLFTSTSRQRRAAPDSPETFEWQR